MSEKKRMPDSKRKLIYASGALIAAFLILAVFFVASNGKYNYPLLITLTGISLLLFVSSAINFAVYFLIKYRAYKRKRDARTAVQTGGPEKSKSDDTGARLADKNETTGAADVSVYGNAGDSQKNGGGGIKK